MGGVFIDIDHYFWYVYKFRKFGIIKAYKFHKNKPFLGKDVIHIFHTVEFIVLCAILSFFSAIVLTFTIGLVTHIILDIASVRYAHEEWGRTISLVGYISKRY